MARAREQRFVITLLIPLMAAHVVGACASLSAVPPANTAPTTGMRSVTYHHSVEFLRGASDLTGPEATRLELFLTGLPVESRIDFVLSGRMDEAVGRAPNFDLATRRVSIISNHIHQQLTGRAEFEINAPSRRAVSRRGSSVFSPSGSDFVEISATSHRLQLPNCPIWSRDLGLDPNNLPLANLGCASAINLGLMVADPADLEEGRSFGGSDGGREADAIGRYRTDKVRELRREGATKQ